MRGSLFIVSAPSGAGKTTLVDALLKKLGPTYGLERVITYTSKKPRASEVNGVHYHFITPKEFEQKIKEGFFIEWSGAYGSYYGSPRAILEGLAKGSSYIMILDRAGARAIAERIPGATLIWIAPPSLYILRQRLELRGQDSLETIERRLKLADQELEDELRNPQFSHHILNENWQNALAQLESIVLATVRADASSNNAEMTI